MTEQTRSKLPYGLVISLVINALLIGLIIGGGLGKRGGDKQSSAQQMPSEMQLLRGLESRLSRPERRVLRTAIRKTLREGAGSHVRMREARAELAQLLMQDQVSAEEINRVLDKIREVDEARRTVLHAEIANQISLLSVEERRELLANLPKRRRFRDGMGHRGQMRGDPPPNAPE